MTDYIPTLRDYGLSYLEFLDAVLDQGFVSKVSILSIKDPIYNDDFWEVYTSIGLDKKDVVVLTTEQRKKFTELRYAALLGVD